MLASEQISLFGLVLAPKKPVHYGRIAPGEAHDIFVRQALVTGEINTRAGFVADNLKTLEQAREEEAKLRRAGLVADEDWQARWYLDRIPSDLHSAAGPRRLVQEAGAGSSGARCTGRSSTCCRARAARRIASRNISRSAMRACRCTTDSSRARSTTA